MLTWTVLLLTLLLLLGLMFSALVIFSLSRSARGGDLEWQLARLERKVDLILTHLGIGHDEHIPASVVDMVMVDKIPEALEEYRRLTGVNARVAQREILYLRDQVRRRNDQKPVGA